MCEFRLVTEVNVVFLGENGYIGRSWVKFAYIKQGIESIIYTSSEVSAYIKPVWVQGIWSNKEE